LWCGERDIGRAGGFDVLYGFKRSSGEIVKRRSLFGGRLDRLLELIDRQAGNVTAIGAAHLGQLFGRCARHARSRR